MTPRLTWSRSTTVKTLLQFSSELKSPHNASQTSPTGANHADSKQRKQKHCTLTTNLPFCTYPKTKASCTTTYAMIFCMDVAIVQRKTFIRCRRRREKTGAHRRRSREGKEKYYYLPCKGVTLRSNVATVGSDLEPRADVLTSPLSQIKLSAESVSTASVDWRRRPLRRRRGGTLFGGRLCLIGTDRWSGLFFLSCAHPRPSDAGNSAWSFRKFHIDRESLPVIFFCFMINL